MPDYADTISRELAGALAFYSNGRNGTRAGLPAVSKAAKNTCFIHLTNPNVRFYTVSEITPGGSCMSEPQTLSTPCSDKSSLIADIRLAMNTIAKLNDEEIAAVLMANFPRLASLRAELEDAREWKYSIMDAYQKHVEEHGC